MNDKKRKMRSPIIVSIILIIYYVVYFGLLFSLLDGGLKYLFGVLPIIFAILIITVCVERIKEIKRGEEDDLSKY